MINTSELYKQAITAPSEITRFNAVFDFIPKGAKENAVAATTVFGRLGNRLTQLNNRKMEMGARWGSLEQNRCTLGGGVKYVSVPGDEQTGEWSQEMCGSDGRFTPTPYIEYILDKAYDLVGCQIVFDDKGGEWGTEIGVTYYNAQNAVIANKTVINDKAVCDIDFQSQGVKKIRFDIKKWSVPRRFAKVCQCHAGQIRYFTSNDIYSFTLREEITPYRQIVTPEFTMRFNNENQQYNIINPGGVTEFLREMMKVSSRIGIDTGGQFEDVNTGDFYLFSWGDKANEDEGEFLCRPDLAFTNTSTGQLGESGITVLEVANLISTRIGLIKPIQVDEELKNIQLYGLGTGRNIMDTLTMLAIACNGYFKFERDGGYSLKSLKFDAPLKTIDFNNMWEKPRITQEKLLAGVRLTYRYDEYLTPNTDKFGRIEEITSHFVLTRPDAINVAVRAKEYLGRRLTYEIPYRGDMSIQPGDTVNVETDYGYRKIFVTSRELTYTVNEHLQDTLTGVGYD